MPISLNRNTIGAVAVALGCGAAIAATMPEASADTGRGAAGDSAQHTSGAGPARHASTTTQPSRRATVARATRRPEPPRAATVIDPPAPAPRAAVQQAAAQPRLWLSPTLQGPRRLSSGPTGAGELSGITYAGGTSYLAVGDNGANSIWQVAASISTGLGWITSSAVTGGIGAPALGRDSEGIALHPDKESVWVSDEIASTITEFSLSDGTRVSAVAVPEIYRPANVQNNFGLEALTYGAGKLWTANEEALKPDGALSTTRRGSWVRIQEFGGADLTPATQYGYRTDRIAGMSPFIDVERSGLVDLLALPDGRVLALEREVGGFLPTFRSRIYELDFSSASDVSQLPSLADGGFTEVRKRLLWQGSFLLDNFEGMTLGPKLNNGAYSVVLVSDDGAGQNSQRQDLYSLILRGVR